MKIDASHVTESCLRCASIPGEEGEALPKLAVAWILANPAITSVILGASRTGN